MILIARERILPLPAVPAYLAGHGIRVELRDVQEWARRGWLESFRVAGWHTSAEALRRMANTAVRAYDPFGLFYPTTHRMHAQAVRLLAPLRARG
jgi:hypothetical protein